jgi:DNA double-strand break repair helicase HerA and related ATPase
MAQPLPIARTSAGKDLALLPAFANRHGLITGATGTGKTVTMQLIAESFSRIGVPAFMADVKGDVSGLAAPGSGTPKVGERLRMLEIEEPTWAACPVTFWDVFGERGHGVRATISDMGPLLLGRLLNLNDVQHGVLTLIFKIADDQGLLLLDLKDVRAVTQFVGDNAAEYRTSYGNVSAASIGAIQRGLLDLEQQGTDRFFGEPMLDIADLIQTDGQGRGMINVLAADRLMTSPKVYSTFLLWMLSELFENLPEVGDPEKPVIVFFFDEAHLLFTDAPAALTAKIEQVVRLIRSKGVGIYFVTQSPLDLPDGVLGQLGNRVQHALRAFSPRDQKIVKAAAQTMRTNPAFDAERAMTELAVGEALVSLLDDKGSPAVVERAWILPPASRIGPVSEAEREAVYKRSVLYGHYEKVVDRESAYEKLSARTVDKQAVPTTSASQPPPRGLPKTLDDLLLGSTGPRGGHREGMLESAAKSAARAVGSQIGRAILRGVLGSIGGKRT